MKSTPIIFDKLLESPPSAGFFATLERCDLLHLWRILYFNHTIFFGLGLNPRTANQCRALLIDIFNHAAAKGMCPDNRAASTINRIEKKQRKRHTIEGLKAIREKSPAWLQNAIDLALITAQRRTDILNMRFDGVREGFLYVVQQTTAKATDAAWIR